jgi:methyl-accepting chemotaxis protein
MSTAAPTATGRRVPSSPPARRPTRQPAKGTKIPKAGRPPRTRRGGLLRNLQVSQKLLVSFGVLCLLLIAVGVTGLVEVNRAGQRMDRMYQQNLHATALIGEIRAKVQEATAMSAKLILRSAVTDVSSVESSIAQLDTQIDKTWAQYATIAAATTETDRGIFLDLLADYREARSTRLVPAARNDDLLAYLGALNSYIDPLTRGITVSLNNLAKAEDQAAQQQRAAAARSENTARILTVSLIAGALALALLLGLLVSRAIARPLRQTVTVLEGLAEGRLDQRLTVTGRDEVGRMAGALNTALDRLTTTLRGINAGVGTLAASSEQLTAVAGQMRSSAARSAGRADAVSDASRQISENITTVSAGAEEIGSSIGEIARSTSSAAEVAGKAVRISTEAGAILQQLGTSSAEIVNVVKIITNIAEQTNLLALNATIEAARAGDAGKGFAVVAGEVKELAQETASATEDIRTRVSAIEADSAAAVTAIAEIGAVIDQINNTQTAIAAAVEEQTATTNEMSRNVSEVAGGTQQISTNVAEVAEAAAETTQAADGTAAAADDLARVAADLQQSLSMFRY